MGKEHALHLENMLGVNFEEVSTDWSVALFFGICLKLDYDKLTDQLSMPGYVETAFVKFSHTTPKKREHGPHP